MVSVYTSTNGTFEWTITNDTTYDSSEDIAIYQSAFDRWDSVVTMNERFDHTITFSISITDMGSGVLGSAWISSHKIIDTDTGVITTTTDYNAGTFGNKVPFTANINMNY